jgi:hypothetical protein
MTSLINQRILRHYCNMPRNPDLRKTQVDRDDRGFVRRGGLASPGAGEWDGNTINRISDKIDTTLKSVASSGASLMGVWRHHGLIISVRLFELGFVRRDDPTILDRFWLTKVQGVELCNQSDYNKSLGSFREFPSGPIQAHENSRRIRLASFGAASWLRSAPRPVSSV